ncbi:MAG: triose-phosphate isomerase [Patescibacteria group bacterium]|nr:triose-phosphate isomerase [Patescibacteria group bacterium]
MIFLSLKTYPQASGDQVIKLCQIVKKVQDKTKIKIMVGAQAFDIRRIKKEVGIEVWAQHLDPIDPGRHFGWLSPYSAKQAGATGTMINHAEHAVDFDTIKATMKKCQSHNLKTLVGTDSINLAKKVINLKPNYLAFENPDLIAGNTSFVDVDADRIKQVIDLTPMPFFVGAGISKKSHVQKTIKLGGQGVILASGVIKANDQETALYDLASGFQNHTFKVR